MTEHRRRRPHRPPDGQWTQEDVAALFAEKRYDEIENARVAGKLADLLAGEDDDQ